MWGSSDPSCEVGEGQREVAGGAGGAAAAWAEGSWMRLPAPGGGRFHGSRATGKAPPSVDTASSPPSAQAANVPSSPHQGLFLCYFASARRRGFYD